MALAKKNLFFSENRTQNVLEKLAPEPFLKDPNWVYHWKQSERLYSLFILYIQIEDHQNIVKLRCLASAFISYKVFTKIKMRPGTSLPSSFSAWFLKKNIYMLYSINWPYFVVWLSLLLEIFGNMCILINARFRS